MSENGTKFDEAAFDAAVSKPNGWSGVADPVAEIRRMRDGEAAPTSPVTPDPLAAILAEMRDIAGNMETAAKKFDVEHRLDKRCLKHPHCFRADDLLRDANELRDWADRIEAAYKREHADWHAETDAAKDDRNRVACRMRREFAEKCRNCTERSPGNAAEMREALNSIADIAKDAFGGPERHREASQGRALSLIIDAARAALAAPARNCDVGTVEKQAERQSRFCMSQAGRCTTCPADRPTHNACVLAWAQMPFAPTEGEAK